ncbi:hypothetical protein [Methylobacterium sp. ID0610]|uniref:hypothetical protein n=1 Tax=Methylobacterium carpenticola TaxID=3344827 RepID=UPI003693297F
MPSVPHPAARPAAGLAAAGGQLAATRTALFLSAFLLFTLPPIATRMALPRLGGAPAVWSVALVCVQAALLGGLLYARDLDRRLSPRRALAAQLALMAAALLTLPIHLPAGFGRPPADREALWAFGLFAVAIGLPLLTLAANGPLLLAWFIRSDHPRAGDPGFLPTASHAGSFAALIADPVLIAPFLSLHAQALVWTFGFGALTGVIAAAGWLARPAPPPAPVRVRPIPAAAKPVPPLTWRSRAGWIALAAVPAGLLIAVTADLSAGLAAASPVWSAPLALYLLTFVTAFRDGAERALRWLAPLQAWGTALAILALALSPGLWTGLALPLGLLPINAGLCHTALYRARPETAHLPSYYVCIALGRVLGAVTCGLVAPRLPGVAEYPLLLGAALACRPGLFAGGRAALRGFGAAALVCALLAGLVAAGSSVAGIGATRLLVGLGLLGLLVLAWGSPHQTAVTGIAALAVLAGIGAPPAAETVRSFFGTPRIATTPDGSARLLLRGRVAQEAMRLRDRDGSPAGGRPEPLLSAAPDGPLGSAIRAVRAARGGHLGSVAVLGLGAGSLACAAQDGEAWTFLEGDPAVIRIARDPARFRFLAECGPTLPVLAGEPRLALAEQPPGLGLILVDAAASEALPAHWLTVGAVRLALAKLDRTGVLLVQISHPHLALAPVLARAGAALGLSTWTIRQEAGGGPIGLVALVRDPAHLGSLAPDTAWRRVPVEADRRPWTDDHAGILAALIAGRGE